MDLYVNTGAGHPTRRSRPVFRAGEWTYDTVALKGDVFPASEEEVKRFAHKLHRVEAAAYPPLPGAGEADAGPVAGPSPAAEPQAADAKPAPTPDDVDVIDVSIYHTGGGMYDLPNGQRVKGRGAALAALGVEEEDGGGPD